MSSYSSKNPSEEQIQEKVAELRENQFQTKENVEYNIVVIGKTGAGKSATANTIFGQRRFEDKPSTTSVTVSCVKETVNVGNRVIHVVETPGLANNRKSEDEVDQEIANLTNLFPGGVHAFIYVMNMASPRLTDEDRNVILHMKELYGEGFVKYCLVVFCRGDPDADLQEYVEEEKAKNTTLGSFFNDLNGRILAIDNTQYGRHREEIILAIDRMKETNEEMYTLEILGEYHRLIDQRRSRMLNEVIDRCHESGMSQEDLEDRVGRNVTGRIDSLRKMNEQLQEQEEISEGVQERLQHTIDVVKGTFAEQVQEIRREFQKAMDDHSALIADRCEIFENRVAARIEILENKVAALNAHSMNDM